MYKPISELFEEIPDNSDTQGYLETMLVDKDMVSEGIKYDTNIIYNYKPLIYNFEAVGLYHLISEDSHKLLKVDYYDPILTDFVIYGFEKDTKNSLLTVVLSTFRDYVENIEEDSSAIERKDRLGSYIFMIACLNTLTNGEFDYECFSQDVNFLIDKIVDKFPEQENSKTVYNTQDIISEALKNYIEYNTYEVITFFVKPSSNSIVKGDELFPYKNTKGQIISDIELLLIQKLFNMGLLTTSNNMIEKRNSEFNLTKIAEKLEEILGYIFEKALELEAIQKQDRLEAYGRIKKELGEEGYAKLLEELIAETSNSQQKKPNGVINSFVEKTTNELKQK